MVRLKYYEPSQDVVVNAGVAKTDQEWYAAWLLSMVESGQPDGIIFFFVTETTDIWEKEKADFPECSYPGCFVWTQHLHDGVLVTPGEEKG